MTTALTGCGASPRAKAPGDAGPHDAAEVEALSREFIALFNACRLDDLAAMFLTNARFVSAGSPVPITGRAGIRQYFSRPCGLEPPAKAALRALAATRDGSMAYVTGSFVLAQPPGGRNAFSASMNFTIVLQREGERWQIAAYHVSQGT